MSSTTCFDSFKRLLRPKELLSCGSRHFENKRDPCYDPQGDPSAGRHSVPPRTTGVSPAFVQRTSVREDLKPSEVVHELACGRTLITEIVARIVELVCQGYVIPEVRLDLDTLVCVLASDQDKSGHLLDICFDWVERRRKRDVRPALRRRPLHCGMVSSLSRFFASSVARSPITT